MNLEKTKAFYMKYKNFIYYSMIILLMFSSIAYAATSNEENEPFDFNEKAQASSLKLAGGGAADTDKESANEKEHDEQDEQKNNQTETPEKPDEKPDIENQSPDLREKNDQTKNPQTNGKPNNGSIGTNNTPAPEKPNAGANQEIEIVEVANEQNRYFTTNLTNNEIVSDPLYHVTVSHLDNTLIPQEMKVSLNGKVLKDYNGKITLVEGVNDIQFQVTYLKKDKKQIRVSQTYRLLLNTSEIIIMTDLKDQTVQEDTITFTVQAKLADKNAMLKVFSGNQELKPLAGNAYKAKLQEGKNNITLSAQLQGKKTEQTYTIVYEEEKVSIELKTDLKDQSANSSKFSFYAKASANEADVPLTVSVNGQAVKSTDGTNYEVQLANGTNVIKLSGQFETERIEREYKILFNDPNVQEKPETDPDAPKLVTDLKSGSTVKGDIKTINVWPVTAKGERIRGKNVLVQVNGEGVPFTWDDNSKTSYKLVLKEGQNHVTIKVWNNEGRTVTESFTVHSQAPGDDGVIGQVTMSVEASTIGIKYLIPPTKMDIHQGERGSYILDQLLREHGYEYGNTGSLDSSFYLREVTKPGMLKNVQIPDDLWALVEKVSTYSNRDAYTEEMLSEFDFANGSGWMYSVNDDYPNYGFSDAYFLDGDTVRVRYTLHYGKDIGGHDSSGGGGNENWDKEW